MLSLTTWKARSVPQFLAQELQASRLCRQPSSKAPDSFNWTMRPFVSGRTRSFAETDAPFRVSK